MGQQFHIGQPERGKINVTKQMSDLLQLPLRGDIVESEKLCLVLSSIPIKEGWIQMCISEDKYIMPVKAGKRKVTGVL